MTTPIEKILPREALAHIRPHKDTREERNMLARRLADVSRQRAELKMLVAKAITVLRRHKEHDDCRHLSAELAKRIETL